MFCKDLVDQQVLQLHIPATGAVISQSGATKWTHTTHSIS